MKLSEAIRAGSVGQEQGRHDYFYQGKCCAIGAAAIHRYGRLKAKELAATSCLEEALEEAFVESLEHPARCPKGCTWGVGPLINTIHVVAHLNDQHGWTYEQIAEWVESQNL